MSFASDVIPGTHFQLKLQNLIILGSSAAKRKSAQLRSVALSVRKRVRGSQIGVIEDLMGSDHQFIIFDVLKDQRDSAPYQDLTKPLEFRLAKQ